MEFISLTPICLPCFDHCLPVRAPVGQTETHCPQNSQSRSSSKDVMIFESNPRYPKSIASTPWISSHALTHLPHMMHFSRSLSMNGLPSFFSYVLRSPSNLFSRMPKS